MVTDDVILEHLITIGNDVAEIKANQASVKEALVRHENEDYSVFEKIKDRVTVLEDESNQKKGVAKVATWAGSILGGSGVLGVIWEYWHR